jgi:hypothetical protein
MVLSASYSDKGGNNIKALTGSSAVSLQGSTITFTGSEKVKGFAPLKFNGANLLILPATEGWFALEKIDLTSIGSANVSTGWQTMPEKGFSFEIRLDTPNGKLIGKGSMPAPKKGQQGGVVIVPITKVTDGKLHTLYFLHKSLSPVQAGVMSVQFTASN